MADDPGPESAPVQIRRWPTERGLLVLVIFSALTIWVLLAVSLVSIAYAVMIGAFFLLTHLAFVGYLRGSGIRLGPEQLPELHARVSLLSHKVGLTHPPDAYVIQAGGQLNALATRFLGTDFIVLYSDLLEACGDNEEARDFIIAHELGHLKSGHLRMRWLLIPGLVLPFIGTAYSRACEFTCDRFGFAVGSDKKKALEGLCILAGGGQYGRQANVRALVAQRHDVNTVLMKISQWLSTHPPISQRLAELDPTLSDGRQLSRAPGVVAASAIVLLMFVPAASALAFIGSLWPKVMENLERQQRMAAARTDPEAARAEVDRHISSLVSAAEDFRADNGTPPIDVDELYDSWHALNAGEPEPIDPFDGQRYGYEIDEGGYFIWSTGPDPEDPDDNIYYSSEGSTED